MTEPRAQYTTSVNSPSPAKPAATKTPAGASRAGEPAPTPSDSEQTPPRWAVDAAAGMIPLYEQWPSLLERTLAELRRRKGK